MQIEVVDSPEARRYEAFADGVLAGFVDYRLHDGEISLVHTGPRTRSCPGSLRPA